MEKLKKLLAALFIIVSLIYIFLVRVGPEHLYDKYETYIDVVFYISLAILIYFMFFNKGDSSE